MVTAGLRSLDLAILSDHGSVLLNREADQLIVTTRPIPWHYAVSFPIPTSNEPIRVTVGVEVKDGAIGIGLLTSDGSTFIEETIVPTGAMREVTFDLSNVSDGTRLVVRTADLPRSAKVHIVHLATMPLPADQSPQSDIPQHVMVVDLDPSTASAAQIFEQLARFDIALHANSEDVAALTGRTILALLLDDSREIAECSIRLSAANTRNAREVVRHCITRLWNNTHEPQFVNVGGGFRFHHLGWRNLEAVKGALNPHPFELSPLMSFPFEDNSIKLIYSSHCIEHLTAETVDRVLQETRRVLRDDGFLLLKIPDFDAALSSWKRNDEAFFDDSAWYFSSVWDTWPNRGVEISLDTKAGMLFCGFWNDAYGQKFSHFARGGPRNLNAYHGPPVLRARDWDTIRKMDSPFQIALTLADFVRRREASFHFNHQIAWSRIELTALLHNNGFAVESMDRDSILRRFSMVPQIETIAQFSLYCVASRA